MLKPLATAALLLATGCATLDTSRPIEKGEGLWWGTAQQDGRILEAWGTRQRLLEFEASRPAARRSLTESYVAMGTGAAGLALLYVGAGTDRKPVANIGFGVILVSIVPSMMAWSDYMTAIDRYNTRFEPTPAASRPTLVPYVAVEGRGGEAGVAGRF